MKVLYTFTSYPPTVGGAEIHTHELAKRMSREADVRVIRQWHENRTDRLLGSTVFSDGLREGYSIDGIPVSQNRFSPVERYRNNLRKPRVQTALRNNYYPYEVCINHGYHRPRWLLPR